jgi:Histidine kinase-, DNA gyrase B-, and HSP90-like ATPase
MGLPILARTSLRHPLNRPRLVASHGRQAGGDSFRCRCAGSRPLRLSVVPQAVRRAGCVRRRGQRSFETSFRMRSSTGAPDAPVRVVLTGEEASVRIEVVNRGPALEPSALEQIFDPLKRGTSERRATDEGLGLGLYIVREVARAHGARSTCVSIREKQCWAPVSPQSGLIAANSIEVRVPIEGLTFWMTAAVRLAGGWKDQTQPPAHASSPKSKCLWRNLEESLRSMIISSPYQGNARIPTGVRLSLPAFGLAVVERAWPQHLPSLLSTRRFARI